MPNPLPNHHHFLKLNDTKYIKWVMHMEANLIFHKLWNRIVKIRLHSEVQNLVQWQEKDDHAG
ncbi:hypothetical protein BV20DRAFT_1054741 [Pilatotrama ljubarskyi]|nr:hypothetical protein BV20DRAFT_1054741 [Pilatotrama ljubarskyi]